VFERPSFEFGYTFSGKLKRQYLVKDFAIVCPPLLLLGGDFGRFLLFMPALKSYFLQN